MNGIRNLAEDLDRHEEPGEQEEHAEELGPSWNHSVIPNRLSVSPRVAMKAPMAIRIVAGTRLWSFPANSARIAPGSDATRLTMIATSEMARLNRNSSPGWFGSSE